MTATLATAADAAGRQRLPRTITQWRTAADWRGASAESILLMLLGVAFSVWLRPHDPFWNDASFPWLWLLSTVIALRYGSLQGLVAITVAAFAWLVLARFGLGTGAFPRVDFFGGLVLALIAGEFSDVWTIKLHQAHAVSAYLDERLQSITRNHFLLGVSHERLEQELISRPYTLREMMLTLRGLILADTQTALPASAWLLQFLVQSTRIESAALYVWDGERLVPQTVAEIGDPGPLATNDAMLMTALADGNLTHVQSERMAQIGSASQYLICAPLLASSGRLLGVLVVRRMAFTALTLETLQFMTVALGYYADGVDAAGVARPILLADPRCPAPFATELARLSRIEAITGMRSALISFAVREDSRLPPAEWFARIRHLRRTTDLDWETARKGWRALIVLLPLTGEAGVSGYLERIAAALKEQYGMDMGDAGLTVHTALLDGQPPVQQLQSFLGRLDA
ncbi:MAG: PelD GGDEF domain-containing protein [Burkholderiaceae bacterium]